jgi:hypothetical protein
MLITKPLADISWDDVQAFCGMQLAESAVLWFVDGAGPEPRASTTQVSFAPLDLVTSRLP